MVCIKLQFDCRTKSVLWVGDEKHGHVKLKFWCVNAEMAVGIYCKVHSKCQCLNSTELILQKCSTDPLGKWGIATVVLHRHVALCVILLPSIIGWCSTVCVYMSDAWCTPFICRIYWIGYTTVLYCINFIHCRGVSLDAVLTTWQDTVQNHAKLSAIDWPWLYTVCLTWHVDGLELLCKLYSATVNSS